jgi:lysophospholipase L1-like esterase
MKSRILYLLLPIIVAFLIISCNPTKIACVGDSITYGSGIAERDSLSYPQQLQNILGKKYKVVNFGVSGATMLKNGNKPYWEEPEFKSAKEFVPDVVIMMLGTNDSKTFNWNPHKNEFITDYNSMIQTFKKLNPKCTIYIGLPPPVIENKWDIQKTVVEFEIVNILKEIAAENGLKTIDFFSLFHKKSKLLPDGVHPNAEGAKMMADEVSIVFLNK